MPEIFASQAFGVRGKGSARAPSLDHRIELEFHGHGQIIPHSNNGVQGQHRGCKRAYGEWEMAGVVARIETSDNSVFGDHFFENVDAVCYMSSNAASNRMARTQTRRQLNVHESIAFEVTAAHALRVRQPS